MLNQQLMYYYHPLVLNGKALVHPVRYAPSTYFRAFVYLLVRMLMHLTLQFRNQQPVEVTQYLVLTCQIISTVRTEVCLVQRYI